MYDLKLVGKKIVDELRELIREHIIVTNEQGIIMASSEKTRIGEFHEGSLLAMKNQEIIHMTEKISEQLTGVRPGMVFPIVVENHSIGVIGVTGDPQHISQYGMLVKKLAEMLISDFVDQRNHLTRERYLYELLHNMKTANFELYIQQLQLKKDRKYQIILFEQIERSTLEKTLGNYVITRINEQQYAALVESDYTNQVVSLFTAVKMAIGGSYPIEEIKKSFQEAIYSLEYCSDSRLVVFENELLIELLIADVTKESALKYVQRLFGEILQDASLYEHIQMRIMTDLSLTEMAEKLHIHRNTLNYRLVKIEEILGFKLNDSKGRASLYMGCLLVDKFNFLS